MLTPVYLLEATKESCGDSLFGLEDAANILKNKFLVGYLSVVLTICRRKNIVLLRELLDKLGRVRDNVYTIPNALILEHFQCGTPKSCDTAAIVVLPRLAYLKGIDLLVATAPRGDGPKLVNLLQMREKQHVQDRIEPLGHVKTNDVHSVIMRGAIFLNMSLTKSFWIAVLEASNNRCTSNEDQASVPAEKSTGHYSDRTEHRRFEDQSVRPYIPFVLRVGLGGLFVQDTAAGGCTEAKETPPARNVFLEEVIGEP
ncbi:hypothetical protein ARMGADRAFT_1088978 [Armillaria gallica]|uniref:Uncharacterized protein n=1 Tax=Armillaria gallica TaxID=47427 RepID=A0A2H3CLR0_ARMGA|nr:hypothetical protein ARMGADRAFT_1088978 [Armillaria gallica]